MKTRGAILRQAPGDWEIVELDLDEPRQGELLVKMAASGLCRTDHSTATGHFPVGTFPLVGGHEGAGIVAGVGPNSPGWSEGDHVALSALPSCGRCRFCATGMGNLCDLNATVLLGCRFDDPTSFRMSLNGQVVGQQAGIPTFAEYSTVSVHSAIRIDPAIPMDRACVVGCGVNTGWGSAVNMGEIAPGQTVIVTGAGGVGNFAIQGAAHAGAAHVIAVDPVAFKREIGLQVGATHACADIGEATDVGRSLTNGQGADATIITVGVLTPEHVADALASVRKAGTVVVTSLGPAAEIGVPISLFELTLFQKRIHGSMFGGATPHYDVTRMLELYTAGRLKLDEVITRRYRLNQVNDAYADMQAGRNIRGVIVY